MAAAADKLGPAFRGLEQGTATHSAACLQPDLRGLEEFVQLLARAVHQFHAYPPGSPLCLEAIDACGRALRACGDCEELVLRVAHHALMFGETPIGAGTVVEHELVRRLQRAEVAVLAVQVHASVRDLSWFCSDLVAAAQKSASSSLAELLLEHGVETIAPRMASRPEVLSVGAPAEPVCRIVEHERRRREARDAASPAAHLYPPDKGWIRVDPASSLDTISLVDLAILVEDPRKLAASLIRLADDEDASTEAGSDPLERKFGDLARLFSSVDPALSRLLFQKLARSVLDMEPARRRSLLRKTILPGLLDERAEGNVLIDFPDVELADALCLLLDLETANPQVLSTALDRMSLEPGRRQAIVPLLESRVEGRSNVEQPGATSTGQAVEGYARRLLQIDASPGKSFADFAAFDLSMDDGDESELEDVRRTILGTDGTTARLHCLAQLLRLEPNPETVARFLARSSRLLGQLVSSSRWPEVVSWLDEAVRIREAIAQKRPDVAGMMRDALSDFWTLERTREVLAMYEAGGESRPVATAVVRACGGSMAGACVELLGAVDATCSRVLTQLMCDHARLLAPGLASKIAGADCAAARAIVRVLGMAGPGYEAAVASRLEGQDEATAREALRALARIGTGKAAAIIAGQVREGPAWMRSAAEEALWRVPAPYAHEQARELLDRRDFVLKNPATAWRLLDRAVQTGAGNLGATAAALAPLRFRFWNRPVARVGGRAREIATQ
jgi:hypothetical protein